MRPAAIRVASGTSDYEAFARLVAAYVEWFRLRYADLPWFTGEVFGHQSLDLELAALPTTYGPPAGRIFLAAIDLQICGGGAYHRLPDGSCEMKRLFVLDEFHGRGLGRRLCRALISSAHDEGYSRMRLDTGTRLTEALALYRSLGFTECAPYSSYPAHIAPHLVFMELSMAEARSPDTR
jgi:GNAT superfamily N-acetyltransferase